MAIDNEYDIILKPRLKVGVNDSELKSDINKLANQIELEVKATLNEKGLRTDLNNVIKTANNTLKTNPIDLNLDINKTKTQIDSVVNEIKAKLKELNSIVIPSEGINASAKSKAAFIKANYVDAGDPRYEQDKIKLREQERNIIQTLIPLYTQLKNAESNFNDLGFTKSQITALDGLEKKLISVNNSLQKLGVDIPNLPSNENFIQTGIPEALDTITKETEAKIQYLISSGAKYSEQLKIIFDKIKAQSEEAINNFGSFTVGANEKPAFNGMQTALDVKNFGTTFTHGNNEVTVSNLNALVEQIYKLHEANQTTITDAQKIMSSVELMRASYEEYLSTLSKVEKGQLTKALKKESQTSIFAETEIVDAKRQLESIFESVANGIPIKSKFAPIQGLINYLIWGKENALEMAEALQTIKVPEQSSQKDNLVNIAEAEAESIRKAAEEQERLNKAKAEAPTLPESKSGIDLTDETDAFEKERPIIEDHEKAIRAAIDAEKLKFKQSQELADALTAEGKAFEDSGNKAEEAEKKKSKKFTGSKSSDVSRATEPSGLEFAVNMPEDEKVRIISWFEEVKSIAENIQSISIAPKFEVEDNEKNLVGYVATVKQLDDETKQVVSSIINLNAELGDADGGWNRFTETVKSSTNATKEFNAEFQKELATQQIDTLKAKLGELPFDFSKVEEASLNIVDKKSLEAFNNELTLTKERIKTAQAEVKNENSLQAFTAMEKNLERIPVRIDVLEERIKRFASVEGFDKVSGEISGLHTILEKVNTAKSNNNIERTTKAYDELTSAISRVKEQMLLLGARRQSGNTSPTSNENTLQAQALFELLKNADEKFKTVAGKTSEAKVKVDELIASFKELNKEGADSRLISNFEDLAKKLEVKFDVGLSDDTLASNKEFIKNLSDLDKRAKSIYAQKIVNDEQFSTAKSELALINIELEKLKSSGTGGKQLESTIVSFEKAQFAVGRYRDDVKKAEADIHKLNGEFEYWINNSSAAVKDSKFGPMIEEVRKMGIEFENAADPEKANKFANAVSTIKSEVKGAGLNLHLTHIFPIK